MGLREVTKHLKLNQLKCVIISPNMERIQSKGLSELRRFTSAVFEIVLCGYSKSTVHGSLDCLEMIVSKMT